MRIWPEMLPRTTLGLFVTLVAIAGAIFVSQPFFL
jgi:hypothetical protein